MMILSTFVSLLKIRRTLFLKNIHTKCPRVITKSGILEGQVCDLQNGGQYYEFLGVPYAKPPVGKLRFKAPEPIEPWIGLLNATKEGNVCPQKHFYTGKFVGNEDCLYLNVYTPDLNPSSKKAVMVWVYGGAFVSGSGSKELYDPQYLIEDDVIVVTFNYRVGAFGYLSLNNEDIPGNAGGQDQVAAFKWVKENIQNFGGDPNNITWFGHSAGAGSIHAFLMLPTSQGLVNKAILQSSVAISGIGHRSGRKIPLLAQLLGSSSDVKDMYRVFMETKAEDFVRNYSSVFTKDDKRRGMPMLFGWVLEKFKDKERALMIRLPIELLWEGKCQKIPIMLGYNDCDGLSYAMLLKHIEALDKDFERLIPRSVRVEQGSENEKHVSHLIRKFFFGNKPVSKETFPELVALLSDYTFRNDITYATRVQLALSDSPMFLYRFSYGGKLNLYKNLYAPKCKLSGATHGDEISYLFKSLYDPKIDVDSEDDLMRRKMVRMWTNFAKTGKPTPNPSDPLIGTNWPSAVDGKLNFLDINKDLKVGVNPDGDRTAFWDSIYEITNGKHFNECLDDIRKNKES